MPDLTLPEPSEEQLDEELAGEYLAAMTGIFPIRAPSEIEITGANNYAARLRRRITRFIDAKNLEPIEWTAPPSQSSLMDALVTPLDPVDVLKWIKDLPVGVGFNWPLKIQAAKSYILKAWPQYENKSLGPEEQELSLDEYGDVWQLTTTLNDPESIFDDLDSMLLLPMQVAALAACRPKIYEKIKQLTMLALRPMIDVSGVTVKKKKDLDSEREDQLRILLSLPLDAPIEIKQEEAPAPKPSRMGRSGDNDSQLPSEHIAQTRTAAR